MKDLVIYGVTLQVGNQFVCWNSYKSNFYLGKKSQSEIFNEASMIGFIFKNQDLTKQTLLALTLFPSAKRVYITKDNS